MMKSWIIPGIIILGAILMAVAVFLPSRTFDNLSQKVLLTTVSVSGKATVQGLDQIDMVIVKKNTPVKNLDLIKTAENSEVSLRLNELNAEVRILENSEILIEQKKISPAITLNIRQGDLIVEDYGKDPSQIWINQDGRQILAMDYSLSNEKNMLYRQAHPNKLLTQNEKVDDQLTQPKIEEILNSKKTDFFRCYGQLIQRQEQAHGQVLLSFEIMSIGKVVQVQISKTDIQDSQFLSCLKEVVARLKFPKFSGENITSFFPLKFE